MAITKKTSSDLARIPENSNPSGTLSGESGGGNMTEYAYNPSSTAVPPSPIRFMARNL